MKLPARDAALICTQPPGELNGLLIFGDDPGMAAERRRQIVGALTRTAGDDLQVTALDGAEARRDAAAIDTALKSPGFFGGRPIVIIENATDGLAKPLGEVTLDLSASDGFLLVTAGFLPARSSLRKLFEGSKSLGALQILPENWTPRAVSDAVGRDGGAIEPEAADRVASSLSDMDYGSGRQLIETIALAALDRETPLSTDEVALLIPSGLDADIDRFVDVVASGRAREVGALLKRLEAGGTTTITLCLALQRHFRMLFRAAETGLGNLRPPLFGQRKEAVTRQLRVWTGTRLEQACRLLFETDSRLRSTSRAPDWALLERASLRLAMMASP